MLIILFIKVKCLKISLLIKSLKKSKNKVVEVFEKWTFLKCPKLKKGRSLFFRKNEKFVFAVKCSKNIKIRFYNNA